jgi:outer membrane lipoprotein-sorting protein
MTVAFVAAVLALCSPSGAEAQNRAIDILDKAAERYGAVETVCADFTQHLLVPLLGNERTGRGRLCQGDPNLFAMRFEDPEGDLIVVDGDFAWVYFPSNDAGTVLKTSADRAAGGRDFHREFLVNPDDKYIVTYEDTEMVEGHSTHRLRMEPRSPMSYRFATIWVDDGAPVLRRLRFEAPPDGALVMIR